MQLNVRLPPGYTHERSYIVSVLLEAYLGLSISSEIGDVQDVHISAGDERLLNVADVFFLTPTADWLGKRSLPKSPLPVWDVSTTPLNPTVTAPTVPVIFGSSAQYYLEDSTTIHLSVDIFGSAFFMLTRYEEIVSEVRDQHERFPASASLAYKEGFLERPIVDEYAEILWAALKRLWPTLARKPRTYRFLLSHDVDKPLASKHLVSTLRGIGGDLLRDRRLGLIPRRLLSYVRGKSKRYGSDPYNTFDWLLEQSENAGIKSAFYFICDHTAGRIDGDYTLDDPWIQALLLSIFERGHEIGLHPSYNSYSTPGQIGKEFELLLSTCRSLGIEQETWGGRQHYLRWEAPGTWQAWEDAGLNYDSSVGFADHAGFRTGTCNEYPVFNVRTGQALELTERPLVVMEQTLLARQYMALSYEAAWERLQLLSGHCRLLGGDFSVLWHNSNLTTLADRDLYQRTVDQLAGSRA